MKRQEKQSADAILDTSLTSQAYISWFQTFACTFNSCRYREVDEVDPDAPEGETATQRSKRKKKELEAGLGTFHGWHFSPRYFAATTHHLMR